MNSTLLIVLASIALLFLIFIAIFVFRERAEVNVEDDVLILKYPFKKKQINIDKELVSWKVQQAHYLHWGFVYSINMLFKSGKRAAVSSRFNQPNYDMLYKLLNRNHRDKREPDE